MNISYFTIFCKYFVYLAYFITTVHLSKETSFQINLSLQIHVHVTIKFNVLYLPLKFYVNNCVVDQIENRTSDGWGKKKILISKGLSTPKGVIWFILFEVLLKFHCLRGVEDPFGGLRLFSAFSRNFISLTMFPFKFSIL